MATVEYHPHNDDTLRVQRGDTFHTSRGSFSIRGAVGGVIDSFRITASMFLDLAGQETIGVKCIPQLRDVEPVPGRPHHYRYKGATDVGNRDDEGWGEDKTARWFKD